VTVAVATREHELQRLYGRFKGLTLAVSAALLLDGPIGELVADADALLVDCVQASAAAAEPDAALIECAEAACALAALVQRAAAGASTADELAELREAHLRLRRQVWNVLPCEYVPCCATGTHAHRGE
jgi:hypothetical protein